MKAKSYNLIENANPQPSSLNSLRSNVGEKAQSTGNEDKESNNFPKNNGLMESIIPNCLFPNFYLENDMCRSFVKAKKNFRQLPLIAALLPLA